MQIKPSYFKLYYGSGYDAGARKKIEEVIKEYEMLFLNVSVVTEWTTSCRASVAITNSTTSLVEINIGYGKLDVSIESENENTMQYISSFFKGKLKEKFRLE